RTSITLHPLGRGAPGGDTMGGSSELSGPDLTQGIAAADVKDGGMLLGHAEGEAVLVARRGDEIFAVGATCTHYSGPLAEGLFEGDTVRCPWHHACFNLRTGQAVRAPALNPIACWNVEARGDRLFVIGKSRDRATSPGATPLGVKNVVVLGGG